VVRKTKGGIYLNKILHIGYHFQGGLWCHFKVIANRMSGAREAEALFHLEATESQALFLIGLLYTTAR
jgi:hypothetical protein